MFKNTSKTLTRITFIILFITLPIIGNAQILGNKVTNLSSWQFSKNISNGWTTVSVPHSYNAIDGHSPSYYRGKAYYKKTLTFTESQINHPLFLLFEGAAQAAEVSVNGKCIARHKGGYTAFAVSLKDAVRAGDNEVIVTCDNKEDVELIPVSSDFNKNGGLHNPVFLLEMNNVYASPIKNGLYRIHVATPQVSTTSATTRVATNIVNASSQIQKLKVTLTLTDKNGKVCYKDVSTTSIAGNASTDYEKNFTLNKPHLWNGLSDPYLYKVQIVIADASGQVLDKVNTKIGYRFYRMDAEKGFFLNGKSYPLRGVAIHQDWNKQASAVTNDHFDKDYSLVKEIGANFVRLAHYPHNDYAFRKCDELGIIVQTEIPWVNVCGVNASQSYFDNIHQQMKEMITNLYNHPSICFWGMWNELDTWGNTDKLQGKLDAARVVSESAKLYDLAKSIDPYRKVGMSDCTLFKREGYSKLKADYFSDNRYDGWYYGKFEDFTKEYTDIHKLMGITNVSEYGSGNNPFCQSYIAGNINNKDGAKHYEEWANRYHESHISQIMKMPFLNFTSLWIMFDFPVASRTEGYLDSKDGVHFTENNEQKYMNDKGLVTRDRQTKKDVFYLYKAWWNKHQTTVYIAGRRRSKPAAGNDLDIKVYSNARSLTLYQNGQKVQTLKGSGEDTGIIWKFNAVKAKTSNDIFKVVSDNGTTDKW